MPLGEDTRTRVVHCKREPYDVYIGRPGPWGNPFVVGRHGDRDEVIRKFREELHRQLEHEQAQGQTHLMRALAELHGKTLGCWCAPQACHGDVLAHAAEWAHSTLTANNSL